MEKKRRKKNTSSNLKRGENGKKEKKKIGADAARRFSDAAPKRLVRKKMGKKRGKKALGELKVKKTWRRRCEALGELALFGCCAPQACQSLYFCTSKASKLSLRARRSASLRFSDATRAAGECQSLYFCTSKASKASKLRGARRACAFRMLRAP
jgi:hypothetical protein